jgi:hypothetical protein
MLSLNRVKLTRDTLNTIKEVLFPADRWAMGLGTLTKTRVDTTVSMDDPTPWRTTMARHHCAVPGCPHRGEGRHVLTLRLRRPDTSAVWAPTTGLYLCDSHATQGCEIEITVRPKKNRKVKVTSVAVNPKGETGPPEVAQADITQEANRTY